MASRDALDPDGLPPDGVGYYPADAQQMESYAKASEQLSRLDAPVFLHAGDPHEYLFVASCDGTSSDKSGDPRQWTAVGKIDDQIEKLIKRGHRQLGRGYVPGPGTEQNWVARIPDLLEGHTVDERAETMYKQFVEQAKKWLDADPHAQIRVAGVGFSRGTSVEVAFLRMVHERGILDPTTATYQFDRDGIVRKATYVGPPLVAPGQVAQAAVLFDPVNTGMPMEHDRRLPPSVLSGVQVIAANERRIAFKSDRIIDPGLTPDGRFLGVSVAGAHGDIGGNGDARNGLAARSANLGIDFLNSLSDRPFLTREVEPDDPRLNVVHRSEEGLFLYQVMPKVNRANPNGQNELLVPERDKGKVADPYNAEPRDEVLNARFEHKRVKTGADAIAAAASDRTAARGLSCRLDRMLAAGQANDWNAFLHENASLAFGVAGRSMWQRAQLCAADQEIMQQAVQRDDAREALAAQREAPPLVH